MVIILYSNQQGSKSRQNPYQVYPPENIEKSSASSRYLWVRTTASTVWSAGSISESEVRATEKTVWCAAHLSKSSKMAQHVFLAFGGLHEDQSCSTLQKMAPITVKTVHQTSLLHIESNLDRLILLSPTHGQRSQQHSGEITLQTVLINKLKFLEATGDPEINNIVIPRSMVVEVLSW